jgi:hypothetical protein
MLLAAVEGKADLKTGCALDIMKIGSYPIPAAIPTRM